LLQQVRQEIPSEAALSQVVTEAIYLWLEKRLAERSTQERAAKAQGLRPGDDVGTAARHG
jgi:hypothetical protein